MLNTIGTFATLLFAGLMVLTSWIIVICLIRRELKLKRLRNEVRKAANDFLDEEAVIMEQEAKETNHGA